MTREQEYEQRWGAIPWRTPLPVQWAADGRTYYACRFCIALRGLKGKDVGKLPRLAGDVMMHIALEHPERSR